MNLATVLLVVASGLLAVVALYWGGLAALVLGFALRGARTALAPDTSDRGEVLVLVPSHHEGAVLIDTVRTLLDQDYGGPITVAVLVDGFDDESVSALTHSYGTAERGHDLIELSTGRDGRRALVLAAGVAAKWAKLNMALDALPRPDFVGFLDADHRAAPGWVSSALPFLEEPGVCGVQSRKQPLAVRNLAQVWDAGLSHAAFEAFNRSLETLGSSVTFTGSTAIFDASVFDAVRFAHCITEDTFLSFDVLVTGGRIAYVRTTGSYEEVTPNLQSFVLRRRRWAAGHTHAFVAHLRRGWSGLSGPARWHFLSVGPFFLVPTILTAFFWTLAAYYLVQFTAAVRLSVLGVSTALALACALYLSQKRKTKGSDFVVCWLAIAPHVCTAGAIFYRLFEQETFYYILLFPFQQQLWLTQAWILLAGVLALAVGWIALRPFSAWQLLLAVVTIPLLVFFDLLSALLGLSDFVFRREQWSRIDRTHEYSPASVPSRLGSVLSVTIARRRRPTELLWLPLVLVGVIGLNDWLSIGPCGQVTGHWWPTIFVSSSEGPVLEVELSKSIRDGSKLRIAVEGLVAAQPDRTTTFRVHLNRELIGSVDIPPSTTPTSHRFAFETELGWDTRTVHAGLSGAGLQCVLERVVPTNLIATGPSGLRVNGEPFLLKGLVTTFSSPAVGLTLDRGYQQLKEVGANAARIYHSPTDSILKAAAEHHVLLIAQPDRSTWENADIMGAVGRHFYDRRFEELQSRMGSLPFALMLNAGNELEINDRSAEMIGAIESLLADANESVSGLPVTYSTFATFIRYPVDVLGINMLDSGATYWGPALDMVQRLGVPFYASELGGFVAFYESPSPEIRRYRLRRQWDDLARRGAAGAVFYASHDNWAQSVPPGEYNDPLTPEQPDDLRGFWDHANEPKPELETLIDVLADVKLIARDDHIGSDQAEASFLTVNRRAYPLRNVTVTLAKTTVGVGDLASRSHAAFVFPVAALRQDPNYPRITFEVTFSSHHGLRGAARARVIVPDLARGPLALSPQFEIIHRDTTSVEGIYLGDEPLEIAVPASWSVVQVDGRETAVNNGRILISGRGPRHEVNELEWSSNGHDWSPFVPGDINEGDVFIKLRLPTRSPGGGFLVLSGLAATRVFIKWADGEQTTITSHPYRESFVDLAGRSGEVTLRFTRRRPYYLRAEESPDGQAVVIRVAPPYVFAPPHVRVER